MEPTPRDAHRSAATRVPYLNQLIHHGLLRTEVVPHGSLETLPAWQPPLFNSGVLKPLFGHEIYSSVEQLQLSSTWYGQVDDLTASATGRCNISS